MYRLFSLPLIIILFGCGQHNNEGLKSDSISISIDSVRVNAKDQFLYLNSYLRHSDLSEGKKFLFNFNLDKHHIEQIDLDKLELVKKVQMGLEQIFIIFATYKTILFILVLMKEVAL